MLSLDHWRVDRPWMVGGHLAGGEPIGGFFLVLGTGRSLVTLFGSIEILLLVFPAGFGVAPMLAGLYCCLWREGGGSYGTRSSFGLMTKISWPMLFG